MTKLSTNHDLNTSETLDLLHNTLKTTFDNFSLVERTKKFFY